MSENFNSLSLQAYYKEKLTKKEKSELLRYLVREFDYSSSSIQQKLSGGCEMNKRDLILIGRVIEEGLWRN